MVLTASGVEDGQVWTECFTCERLYGAAAAFCPSCLPRGREEHDPAHEWGSVQHAYKPSTDDPGWFEWKCLECQQTIDVAISNSLRKHAHNNFLFSYGRDVRQQVVKRNWKACANKPVRHDDAANEELLSKRSINLWRSMSLSCVTCKDWFICQSCIVGMGPNICHACPKASKSELLLNDTYPMEDKWWSQQTVLLSRQVDPDTMPLTFVVATQCYDKKDADEMSVLPGDRIMVTPYSHYTDWYQGRNDWTGQSGIFPTWCVLIDADAVQVAREQDWLASGAHPCRTSPSASAPSPSRDGEVEATTAKMNVWANALKLGTAVVDAFSSK
ncbi:hypothetical protein H633G_11223 [Metarhizium anisopliae BRIP 53284]|nr:hypothetical protein H633G_11223 [Metarhizium anisopliae BRIP 53284]